MASDKYAIRRALVTALFRFYCPQDLNTILCDDQVILLASDNARIKAQWDELTAAEYIIPVQGFPDHRSLAPALRLKLESGRTLLDDPFFAGPR